MSKGIEKLFRVFTVPHHISCFNPISLIISSYLNKKPFSVKCAQLGCKRIWLFDHIFILHFVFIAGHVTAQCLRMGLE